VNKKELVDAVAAAADLSKAEASRAVESLFGTDGIIASELRAGQKVQITGFGGFVPRQRAAREGRDPRTGGVLNIAAAVVPAFRAGQALKDAVNRRT
jgi:DNA-binding protein HU-beta